MPIAQPAPAPPFEPFVPSAPFAPYVLPFGMKQVSLLPEPGRLISIMSSPRVAPAPPMPPPPPAPGWPSKPVVDVAVTNVHDVQPADVQPVHVDDAEAGHWLPPP